MKNIVFFVPYPKNQAPSQRFRFEQFIPFLNGYNIKFFPFWSKREYNLIHNSNNMLLKLLIFAKNLIKRIFLLIIFHRYDIIYIHLELFPIYLPFFEKIYLKIFKNKIIYDIDDFIFLPHKSKQKTFISYFRNPKRYFNYFKYSKYVFSATRFFYKYIPDYETKMVVIPSAINTKKYIPIKNKNNKKIVIGWSGSVTTSAYLYAIEDILEELKKNYDFEIMIMGNKNFKFTNIECTAIDWSPDIEISTIQKFDIGLYPLFIEEWVLGKCGLKAFQYMALEIPVIATLTDVNKEFIIDGENGFLAKNKEEWYNKLELLIKNPELRKSIGKKARQYIINNYSTDIIGNKFKTIIDNF